MLHRGMKKFVVLAAIAALGLSTAGVKLAMAKGDKGSDIEEIMKKGFKGSKQKPSLIKKATDGTATKEELNTLLKLLQDLQKTTPPKGDKKSWDDRTAALVTAAQEVIKGDKEGADHLKSASACKDCHKAHQKDE